MGPDKIIQFQNMRESSEKNTERMKKIIWETERTGCVHITPFNTVSDGWSLLISKESRAWPLIETAIEMHRKDVEAKNNLIAEKVAKIEQVLDGEGDNR